MQKLIVSSSNRGKIKEIKTILKDLRLDVLSKDEVGLADFSVEEDKDTLEENAIKKAEALNKLTGEMTIADDSGLFVDYLNGAPGIYSARFAGKEGDDDANNKKLLKELNEVECDKRSAVFKTAIALVTKDGTVDVVVGECRGKIIRHKRGENGFGYDPLFVPDGYEKTFAELKDHEKNKISHRRDALDKLREKLKIIYEESYDEDSSSK